MSDLNNLVRAIANAAPLDEPGSIIGAALEFAIAECEGIGARATLEGDQDSMVLASALEGRLRALRCFVCDNLDVNWREGCEPEGGAA